MQNYVNEVFEDAKQLVRDLCKIPAPSFHEENRAYFVKEWFEKNGGKNVSIDDQFNVICPYNISDDKELVVFMAHLDTVFPDFEPMPFEEHDGKMFSPGVLDDTGNLVSLLFAAKYIMEREISLKYGILFIANTREEGLGNLCGSKKIVETYGSRMKYFVTVDGTNLSKIVNQAVGSHRYEVTVETEGGHSFAAFGKPNAIALLSQIICTLYEKEVPKEGSSKTTYNVGIIKGGTSVNTIAADASVYYEYRSDNKECLKHMNDFFHETLDFYREKGVMISEKLIGDRPCSSINQDNEDFAYLVDVAKKTIKKVIGIDAELNSGSTDANSALAKGIPAICVTGAAGGNVHSRSEYLEVDSLKQGMLLLLELIILL